MVSSNVSIPLSRELIVSRIVLTSIKRLAKTALIDSCSYNKTWISACNAVASSVRSVKPAFKLAIAALRVSMASRKLDKEVNSLITLLCAV